MYFNKVKIIYNQLNVNNINNLYEYRAFCKKNKAVT